MIETHPLILFAVFVVIILFIIYIYKKKTKKSIYGGSKDTIFISVASYRDIQCSLTLKDIYKKAKYPDNVYVGVCQQNKQSDPECNISKYCSLNNICNDNQIKILKLDYTEAKGPTFARYHCSKLYDNQEYFLQIDSHTRFVQDWDIKLINMLKKCNSAKPILTYYPLNFDSKDTGIPIICESHFNNDIPTYRSYIFKAPNKPKLTPFVAAGFFFCKGSFLKEVPYDPNLPSLFEGEETLFTIRLWTNGYDFYVPNENIVYHYYERKNEPKFWNDLPNYSKEANETIIKVLYLLKDIDKYGLGKKRTIEQYYKFSKIDKNHKKSNKQWCSKY